MVAIRRHIQTEGTGRRTAKSQTENLSNLLKTANKTLKLTIHLVNVIKGIKNPEITNNIYENANFSGYSHKEQEKAVIESSYRFMRLWPGCGKGEIKRKFREIVKEIRPDINNDEKTKDKYIALKTARDILLKYEN